MPPVCCWHKWFVLFLKISSNRILNKLTQEFGGNIYQGLDRKRDAVCTDLKASRSRKAASMALSSLQYPFVSLNQIPLLTCHKCLQLLLHKVQKDNYKCIVLCLMYMLCTKQIFLSKIIISKGLPRSSMPSWLNDSYQGQNPRATN